MCRHTPDGPAAMERPELGDIPRAICCSYLTQHNPPQPPNSMGLIWGCSMSAGTAGTVRSFLEHLLGCSRYPANPITCSCTAPEAGMSSREGQAGDSSPTVAHNQGALQISAQLHVLLGLPQGWVRTQHRFLYFSPPICAAGWRISTTVPRAPSVPPAATPAVPEPI